MFQHVKNFDVVRHRQPDYSSSACHFNFFFFLSHFWSAGWKTRGIHDRCSEPLPEEWSPGNLLHALIHTRYPALSHSSPLGPSREVRQTDKNHQLDNLKGKRWLFCLQTQKQQPLAVSHCGPMNETDCALLVGPQLSTLRSDFAEPVA